MVASLVEQGCGYLSDEYAVVSTEGTVFPFSKPIRLRTGGNDATYRHFPGVGLPGGFPCAAVIMTRFEAGTGWNPEEVSVGEAILRTLPAALGNRDEPEKVLEALTALVRDAACYEGVRGDSEPSIAGIRALRSIHDFPLEVSS